MKWPSWSNDRRDVAIQHRDTQPLRERIAELVRPLAAASQRAADLEEALRYVVMWSGGGWNTALIDGADVDHVVGELLSGGNHA